jgi:hypothetical protein
VVGGSAWALLSSQEPGFIYVYEQSDSAVRQTCRQGVRGGRYLQRPVGFACHPVLHRVYFASLEYTKVPKKRSASF